MSKSKEFNIEDTAVWQKSKQIASEIMEFIPKEEISELSVLFSCLNYLKYKNIKLNWKFNVDCYLGVPIHIEKFGDLQNIKFAKFPLPIISSLVVQKPFYFSLLREECIDGTTLDNNSHLMHFTPSEFLECEDNFRDRLEKGKLNAYQYFTNEDGFLYMQDENLEAKLINDEVKYAYYFKEALLNDEFYTRLSILKADIFVSSLMLYHELCQRLKVVLSATSENTVDNNEDVTSKYLKWNFKDFHSFLLSNNDAHFKYLFRNLKTFIYSLHSHYKMIVEHFNEDPDNHLLEREIEVIEHLAGNTDQQLIQEIIGGKFERT